MFRTARERVLAMSCLIPCLIMTSAAVTINDTLGIFSIHVVESLWRTLNECDDPVFRSLLKRFLHIVYADWAWTLHTRAFLTFWKPLMHLRYADQLSLAMYISLKT